MPESHRRAKIVCTIGPATRDEVTLRALIRAGMDVARLNFSHGDAEEHEAVADRVRVLAAEEGRTVAVMQDLQGPKIRIGGLDAEPLRLRAGGAFTLTARSGVRGPDAVSVTYRKLPAEVRKGDEILLDDGLIRLEVLSVSGRDVRCRVLEGGELRSHKGMNVPGRKLAIPALTAKDRRDLGCGIEWEVDYVAISFVREAADLEAARRFMRRRGAAIPIIAKLEKPQAVENLDAILAAADGIMVARGDLGVELPPERVPVLQKRMIRLARAAGKPVITATQMLESMVEHSRPTRAEASDVANAVFDGTDAVMLSAETAVGKYPVKAVRMMGRIIEAAEGSRSFRAGPVGGLRGEAAGGAVMGTVASGRSASESGARPGSAAAADVPDAIADAAYRAARDLGAAAIAVFTESGGTARVVSKYRPMTPIYAFSPVESVRRRLALLWGVRPRAVEELPGTDDMVERVAAVLVREGAARKGDLIVVTAGTPVGRPGSTNFLKVHRVEGQ
jgi:pyruvate kinase